MKKEFICTLFGLTVLAACQAPQSCDDYKKSFFEKKTNVIVADKGAIGNVFNIKGIEPITNKATSYNDVAGFYVSVRNCLDIGDTLVKSLNSDTFLIKKKGINIILYINCNSSSPAIPDTVVKGIHRQ